MSRDRIERTLWVLQHVNAQMFMGRFDGRWTRTYDLDAAALFTSEGEAENALSALLQEARDRVQGSNAKWAAQMWWDLDGGAVVVQRLSQITTIIAKSQVVP